MKRINCLILAVISAFSVFAFSSCSEKARESSATPSEILTAAIASAKWDNVQYTKASMDAMESDDRESLISIFYGDLENNIPDMSLFSDYAMSVPGGEASANEVGIFKIAATDASAFDTTKQTTEAFMKLRAKNVSDIFRGYDEASMKKADNALIGSFGNYVYYIMSDNNAEIESIIKSQIEAKYIA
ncbi:hypothetical protein SDC9_147234 [bioreactor metagenome]|uniref:DUF4358 domain-containing protein n=1 Tax=bioreactor metagenome TaxID=1076179 RepID=A0A645EFB4_9ZZZZ|nr:DUF4358 domain-containing protein [Oscillospiraceae bacterium]